MQKQPVRAERNLPRGRTVFYSSNLSICLSGDSEFLRDRRAVCLTGNCGKSQERQKFMSLR